MIEFQGHSITESQVTGSDKEKVESGNRGNLIDAFDRFAILDLKRKKYFFIGMFYVLTSIGKPPIRVCARSIEAAPAQRRKTNPIHPLPSLLRAPAMRDHDPIGAKLQRAHWRIIPGLKNTDH